MDKYNELIKNIDAGCKICAYGWGYLGKKLYVEIPQMFGVKADYICDGDDKKVDEISIDGITPIHKDKLLNTKERTVVFILVDDPYDLQIEQSLKVNDCLLTVSLRELAQMNQIIKAFYGDEIYDLYLNLKDGRK